MGLYVEIIKVYKEHRSIGLVFMFVCMDTVRSSRFGQAAERDRLLLL
jgi:hypothetical protein